LIDDSRQGLLFFGSCYERPLSAGQGSEFAVVSISISVPKKSRNGFHALILLRTSLEGEVGQFMYTKSMYEIRNQLDIFSRKFEIRPSDHWRGKLIFENWLRR
jgi:hypothetical protein